MVKFLVPYIVNTVFFSGFEIFIDEIYTRTRLYNCKRSVKSKQSILINLLNKYSQSEDVIGLTSSVNVSQVRLHTNKFTF